MEPMEAVAPSPVKPDIPEKGQFVQHSHNYACNAYWSDTHMHARVDCILVLCFVMGCVFRSGEIAHKKVHYYYIIYFLYFTVWSDKDGKLHCPNCHRAFNKERHFRTHKCLANSLYIDISKREVRLDSGKELGCSKG